MTSTAIPPTWILIRPSVTGWSDFFAASPAHLTAFTLFKNLRSHLKRCATSR